MSEQREQLVTFDGHRAFIGRREGSCQVEGRTFYVVTELSPREGAPRYTHYLGFDRQWHSGCSDGWPTAQAARDFATAHQPEPTSEPPATPARKATATCTQCGRTNDNCQQKYCGDGSDKDNGHRWRPNCHNCDEVIYSDGILKRLDNGKVVINLDYDCWEACGFPETVEAYAESASNHRGLFVTAKPEPPATVDAPTGDGMEHTRSCAALVGYGNDCTCCVKERRELAELRQEIERLRQQIGGVQGALADAADVLCQREDGDYGASVRQVVEQRDAARETIERQAKELADRDTVPRSRIDAMEKEIQEARESKDKVVENAAALVKQLEYQRDEAIKWGECRNQIADMMTDYVPDGARELALQAKATDLHERIALLAGWQLFPYTDLTGNRWCPPGKEVHVSTIEPLPPVHELYTAALNKLTAESQVTELRGEIERLRKLLINLKSCTGLHYGSHCDIRIPKDLWHQITTGDAPRMDYHT